MSWTPQTTSETAWARATEPNTNWGSGVGSRTSWSGEGNIVTVNILYNASIVYDADYITYEGYYIQNEINWNQSPNIETAWA